MNANLVTSKARKTKKIITYLFDMDAKELRIGNCINYNYLGVTIVSMIESGEDITQASSNEYSQIPLTEEWLLKFGFKKANDGQHFFLNHFGLCLVYDGDDWCLKARIDEPYVILYIRTVHKMQNVYYDLKNEELTIKQ